MNGWRALLDELQELIEEYKRRFKVRLVVLFGSMARGDYTDESDIDLLVVADDLPGDPREAFALLRSPKMPRLNPIGFKTEIFLKKLKEGSTFTLEVLEDGKTLYADREFLEIVTEIFGRVRKEFIRVGKTWVKII